MKKVLVISYYFPPMGMGGVQRTAKFVKFLPDFGWEPVVLTVTPKIYLAKDDCLLHEIEKRNIAVYRTGSKNSSNGHKVVKFRNDSNRKLLSNISQALLIPDSKILWKNKAMELAEKIIAQNNINLVFATAPPYTDFLVAKEIKNRHGIPYVLDYRDSWIDCPNNFYPTPFHKRKHMKMETDVLRNASSVVTINSRIKELIIERYPFVTDDKVSIIPQGFDPDDFEKHSSAKNTGGKMRITYSGSFLNYYTPKYFIDGLRIAADKNPEILTGVEACFIGSFPEEYKTYIKKLGLTDAVNIMGYIEHSLCIKNLIESDVLWMMINKTGRSDLHSTGKLYEYLGARKPILACVPEGVARESLKQYGAVKLTGPDDAEAIAKAILEFFEMYKKGTMPVPDDALINTYDRKKLTASLAEVFDASVVKLEKEVLV